MDAGGSTAITAVTCLVTPAAARQCRQHNPIHGELIRIKYQGTCCRNRLPRKAVRPVLVNRFLADQHAFITGIPMRMPIALLQPADQALRKARLRMLRMFLQSADNPFLHSDRRQDQAVSCNKNHNTGYDQRKPAQSPSVFPCLQIKPQSFYQSLHVCPHCISSAKSV